MASGPVKILQAQIQAQRLALADELELLKVQREARQRQAVADLGRPEAELARIDRLNILGKGFVSDAELIRAKAAIEVARAQVELEKVGVREMDVRIAQAKRRLDEFGRLDISEPAMPPAAAPAPSPPAP